MNATSHENLACPPPVPTGCIKTLGPVGPKYEVGKATRQLSDGDWEVEILLIESGEKAMYSLLSIRDDPEAE